MAADCANLIENGNGNMKSIEGNTFKRMVVTKIIVYRIMTMFLYST
jgi:hypothetical protein